VANWDGIAFEAMVKRELGVHGCRFRESDRLDQQEKTDLLIVGVEGRRDFHRSIPCQLTLRRDAVRKMEGFLKRMGKRTGIYAEMSATCPASDVAWHLLQAILCNNLPYAGVGPESLWLCIESRTAVQSGPLADHLEALKEREARMRASAGRKRGEIYTVTSWGFLIQDEHGHIFFCYDQDLPRMLHDKLGIDRPSNRRRHQSLSRTVPITFTPTQPREGAKHPRALAIEEEQE